MYVTIDEPRQHGGVAEIDQTRPGGSGVCNRLDPIAPNDDECIRYVSCSYIQQTARVNGDLRMCNGRQHRNCEEYGP